MKPKTLARRLIPQLNDGWIHGLPFGLVVGKRTYIGASNGCTAALIKADAREDISAATDPVKNELKMLMAARGRSRMTTTARRLASWSKRTRKRLDCDECIPGRICGAIVDVRRLRRLSLLNGPAVCEVVGKALRIRIGDITMLVATLRESVTKATDFPRTP